MCKKVGIWINHKEAVIVTIKDDGQELVESLSSNMEGHFRLHGGSRSRTPYGPQEKASDSKLDNKYRLHLRQYYKRVIERIKDARIIYLIGPGEAKIQFEKELQNIKDVFDKIAKIETVDKMTENQIVAKVRAFYNQD